MIQKEEGILYMASWLQWSSFVCNGRNQDVLDAIIATWLERQRITDGCIIEHNWNGIAGTMKALNIWL